MNSLNSRFNIIFSERWYNLRFRSSFTCLVEEINSNSITLDLFCFYCVARFRLSTIIYINYANLFSWCWVNMILSVANSTETIVSSSEISACVSHHQILMCIFMYIQFSLTLYTLIDAYFRLLANEWCLKRNFKTFITFLYWILNISVSIFEFIDEIFKDVLNQLSSDISWNILCRMLLNWSAFLKIQSAWWVFWNEILKYWLISLLLTFVFRNHCAREKSFSFKKKSHSDWRLSSKDDHESCLSLL